MTVMIGHSVTTKINPPSEVCGGNQEQNAEIRCIASMLKLGTQITARFRPELYAALEEPIHKSTLIVSNQEVLDRDIIFTSGLTPKPTM